MKSEPTPGVLSLDCIKENWFVIVQLKNQPHNVIHQVMLRPDKIHDGLIRLGETPGDEITGWQYPENIEIVAVLGRAVEKDGRWTNKP